MSEEERKKRADLLWADFKKDTGFKPKAKISTTSTGINSNDTILASDNKIDEEKCGEKQQEKLKVTQIFEFAGEEIKVEKEIPVDKIKEGCSAREDKKIAGGRKSGGGLSSVLKQIGKKTKVTTLEKSKMDWDKFKKDENIEEELQTYNKGKNGCVI